MLKGAARRLVLLSLLALPALAADTPRCPIDELHMWFTGETKTDSGKLLMKYKCPKGHLVWVIS